MMTAEVLAEMSKGSFGLTDTCLARIARYISSVTRIGGRRVQGVLLMRHHLPAAKVQADGVSGLLWVYGRVDRDDCRACP